MNDKIIIREEVVFSANDIESILLEKLSGKELVYFIENVLYEMEWEDVIELCKKINKLIVHHREVTAKDDVDIELDEKETNHILACSNEVVDDLQRN